MAIAAVILDHSLSEMRSAASSGKSQIRTKGRKKSMNENNRVLSRQNARELTPAEVDHVTGNINTLTICSWGPSPGTKDCDTVG
jgi:hypothetical protein